MAASPIPFEPVEGERPPSKSVPRTRVVIAGLVLWALVASAGLGWMIYESSVQRANADSVFLNRLGNALHWASGGIQSAVYWKNVSWGDAALGWLDQADALGQGGSGAPDGAALAATLNLTASNLECAVFGLGLEFGYLRQNGSGWADSFRMTYLRTVSDVLANLSAPLLAVNPDGVSPLTQIGPTTASSIRRQAGEFFALQDEYFQSRC